MKRIFLLFVSFMCLLQFGYSQKVTITGKVTTKEEGTPVIGASVMEKGTTNGTVTNFEGAYSILVSTNSILVYSYIGTEKVERKISGSAVLNVVLNSDAVAIDEVVVTAMGIKSEKKKLNFAVQSINSDDLIKDRSANFVNSLQGKVAGISVTNAGGSPNSGSQVIIRGISSINPAQNNEPLYIVDGMQVSRGGSDINPNDIANITVLKGAAASALYGQEAASGVIMITTKNGSEGKVKVNLNSSWQFDNAVRVPQIQSMYGPGASGFYKDQTGGGWGPPLQPGEKKYDNVGNFLGTGFYHKYDVSASGGTNNFTSYASATYSNNQGVVPNDFLNKIGLLVKGTYIASKNLTINMMANIVNNKSRGFGGAATTAMSPIYNWPINDDMSNYKNPDGSIRWRYLTSLKYDSPMNPNWSRYEDSGQNESTRNLMQGAINWKAFKNFEIVGKLSSDQNNYSTISTVTPRFSKSDFDPILELPNVDLNYFGSFSYYQSKSNLFTASAMATYKVDFTQNFNLNLMAGSELKTLNSIASSLGGRDFIIPGDFYSQQNLGEVINGADKDVSLFRTQKRLYGFFGEIRFDYKGLAHLSVTGRNDHSSTLDPDKNSYFYPSITGGAIFSELFNLRSEIFSYGKIRGNWAKVGKDGPVYQFDRKFKPFPTFPDGGYAADPTSSVAKNLAPEMTSSWEIGTDLRFFNNKTKLDLAYYSTTVNNQIVVVRVSPSSGNILETRNEGEIENYGVEATLEQEVVNNKDFKWNANLNFGFNRGRVVSLPDQLTELQGTQYSDIFPTAYLHGSTTAISGKDYQRTPDGKILCTATGYPVISPAKGNLIGNREPDFLLGLSSTLNYKNMTFSFLFDTRKGGDLINLTSRGLYSSGQHKNLETYRNRQVIFDGVVLQSDGTYAPNTVPIIFDQQTMNNYFVAVSSNFIEDGSYIRLSYVTFEYDFTSLVKKTSIKELKLSFTGRNLFLLTRYTGSDPQINISTSSGGPGAMGIDNYAVPNTRSFNFNLSLTF